MIVSMIAAMGQNRVIGDADNNMPWHLPADLKHFKATTMGKPIVMGRKTYESIGRPLPGRKNIVLTRDETLEIEGCDVVTSPEAALEAVGDFEEVMITGGANVYEQFLSRADRLYLTFIEGDFEGVAYFPEWEAGHWKEVSSEAHQADEKNPHNYRFVELERIAS